MAGLDFLMSRGMQRVLAPVMMHPDRTHSISDLIRASGGGRGSAQNAIATLCDAGVLSEERVGNQRRLMANRAHPLHAELRSMVVKTVGLGEILRDALHPAADRIVMAFAFGSVVAGTERPDSDVDLLVVGDMDLFETGDLLASAERDLGRPIHLTLLNATEWASWMEGPVGLAILAGPRVMVAGHER